MATIYPLPPLALPTDAIGYGSWQTPVADDAVERVKGKFNSRGEPKLSAQVLLPTPAATSYGSNRGGAAGRTGKERHSLESMARKDLWPAPAARGWRCGKASDEIYNARSRPLNERMERSDGGALSPLWVEWLMGFPLGWTALEHWVTRSSRKSRKS